MFFAHFYGVVAYDDNTSAIFESMIDDKGNIYNSNEVASADALAQVSASDDQVQGMLNLLAANIPSIDGNLTEDPKTVVDIVAKLHGRVANADGTWEDFIVQYDPQNEEFIPNSGGVSAWGDAYSNYQDELDSIFKKVNNDVSAF